MNRASGSVAAIASKAAGVMGMRINPQNLAVCMERNVTQTKRF
jgi:hypothetical protein